MDAFIQHKNCETLNATLLANNILPTISLKTNFQAIVTVPRNDHSMARDAQ